MNSLYKLYVARVAMERIFLVGYMGSGKTTVGKKLAKLLSLSFIDLDAHIQCRYHQTIAQLFAEKGEEEFRRIENMALSEVGQIENVIISTGGGTPCFHQNMDMMNRVGTTVYLHAKPEELASRLLVSRTERPIIAGKSREELIPFITEHLAQRECYYKRAQIVYYTDRMINRDEISIVVQGVAEKLRNRDKR